MILNVEEVKHIYVASQYVDMRKSINGLSVLVDQQFEMDVLDRCLFIFTNKARNRIKILYYENNGFWLFMKRLELGKFKIQEDTSTHVRSINSRQLHWLLEGLEMTGIQSKKGATNRLMI